MTTKTRKYLPEFSKSDTKYKARELHISFLYPLLTGNLTIPVSKSYWYLCNKQPDQEGSEIHQLTETPRICGNAEYLFAKAGQCYGVDRSPVIIKRNKRIHPNSNWIVGEWNQAIHHDEFDPALVYLDTTSFADRMPAVTSLKETLIKCDKHTLVICNVMMNNARAGAGDKQFDENALIDHLMENEHPETFANWNVSPEDRNVNIFHSYEYRTSRTLMRSYVFFKGVLPSTNIVMSEFKKFKNWCSFNSQTR
jgi:hypothetical protein